MAATITRTSVPAVAIYPHLVLSYESTRSVRTIVHELLNGGITTSLAPAAPRTGTLELFFLTEADAKYAEDMHRMATTYTLADPDRTSIAMTYVVAGSIRRQLDPETRKRWVVRVDFQEVS